MAIVLVCAFLGLTPFAVYWNYRMTLKDRFLSLDYVMSVIPHEYVLKTYPPGDIWC